MNWQGMSLDGAYLKSLIPERYAVLAIEPSGGMAFVLRAHDTVLNIDVALKIPKLAGLSEDDRNVWLERFRREAQVVAKMDHPNVARGRDLISGGNDGDLVPILVTDFIVGTTVGTLLDRAQVARGKASPRCSGLLPQQAVDVVTGILTGLQYAHGMNIIHRDIKPSNIMIQKSDGRVKIIDFGIAKDLGSSLASLTIGVIGTPAYLAPEQVDGRNQDQRTDLYAVGCVLFELVTGRPPYLGKSPQETMLAHLNSDVPKVEIIDAIPESAKAQLRKIVGRSLQKLPRDRYQSATEMLQDVTAAGEAMGKKVERRESKKGIEPNHSGLTLEMPHIPIRLTGSPKVDSTLSVTVDLPTGWRIAKCQWLRGGKVPIPHADGNHYTLAKADFGHTISAVVELESRNKKYTITAPPSPLKLGLRHRASAYHYMGKSL